MRYTISLFVIFLLISCREQVKEKSVEATEQPEEVEINHVDYPVELVKVFDAHGGLKQWKSMKSMAYEIPKSDFSEVHMINLYSREDRVNTPDYSMGFDGKDVWVNDPDNIYEGDPAFYHNLMFYFYAMPFVLADDGINYSKTADLAYEGKNYPGISISYEGEVGTSPKDEYFIHFDPETARMAWLGYTVTYRTGEKSENVKWIRYGEWQDIDGLLLPKNITWHNYEGRNIQDARSTVEFENVRLSTEALDTELIKMPEGAVVVLPKSHS